MGNSQSHPPLDYSLIHLNSVSRLIINKHIEPDEMHQLARQIRRHDCLTTDLFFHSTPLDAQKITTLLLDGLIKNTSVKTLDLSNTSFSDQCAKPLAQFLQHNTTLETLLLNDNRLTNTGIMIILRALEHNTTLIELQCERNPIFDPNIYTSISKIHTRPAIEYQKRNIDHTIALSILPPSQSMTRSNSNTNSPHSDHNIKSQNNSPHNQLYQDTNSPQNSLHSSRSNKSSLNHSSNDHFQSGQIIVITATPTLSLNNAPDIPRERRRSRTGSKIIEDMPSVEKILNQSPAIDKSLSSSTSGIPSHNLSSRATPTTTTTSSTRSKDSHLSISPKIYNHHNQDNMTSPTPSAVFSQDDDDEALNYLKPRDIHNGTSNDDINSSTSSLHKSASGSKRSQNDSNLTPKVKIASDTSSQSSPRTVSHEDADDDDSDEEWDLNDEEYRRSTTNLGFLLQGQTIGGLMNGKRLNPNKVLIRNLQNVVIDEGREEDEDDDVYDLDHEYDSVNDFDFDDIDDNDNAVEHLFTRRDLAKHGVTIDPIQTGYDVEQTVVTTGDNETHEHVGLDLLACLNLDFDYFGTAQLHSTINLQQQLVSNELATSNLANKKNQKDDKKKKKKDPTRIQNGKEEDSTPTAQKIKKGSKNEDLTSNKTKTKKSTLQFNESDEDVLASVQPPPHVDEVEFKTKKGKNGTKTTKADQTGKPSQISTSTTSLPPANELSAPSGDSNQHSEITSTVFMENNQDNNGTLTFLINQFLLENNSESNALPNFGRMCKLYRKVSITIDRYGQVLLYYFNFSQLCRLLPRLIISLYESEFPGEQIDGQIEWFSTPQQAISLHSMVHYHDTIPESELFQLSLTCCKVPLTLTPYDGAEYISFYRDLTKLREQIDNPQLAIHAGYKLWNSGVAFNLYSWWTKEGCTYTGLAEIEPIDDSIVFNLNPTNDFENTSPSMNFPTLESRLSLDFHRLSMSLEALPINTIGNGSFTPKFTSTQLDSKSSPQSTASPTTPRKSFGPSIVIGSSSSSSTAPPSNDTNSLPTTIPKSPISFIHSPTYKTLDKKSLNKLLRNMNSPPDSSSDLQSDLILPSVSFSFGKDIEAQPSTQPQQGAVKNSPFLAFEQSNHSSFEPLNAPSSKMPNSQLKISVPTPPTPKTTNTPSISTPTQSLPKFKRYKTFQFQLDTIDDAVHGINSSQPSQSPDQQISSPTPRASQSLTSPSADSKFDAIRHRLTLTRKASLTQQLQSNTLLPVEQWVLLARQPNHIVSSSLDISLHTPEKIASTLIAAQEGKLRKEPRLSTLLLHLHLVFPNPSSPTGRYPIIDALSAQPTPNEIKLVYKKVSLILHPDRLINKHPSISQLGTECFVQISSAFKRFMSRHDDRQRE